MRRRLMGVMALMAMVRPRFLCMVVMVVMAAGGIAAAGMADILAAFGIIKALIFC